MFNWAVAHCVSMYLMTQSAGGMYVLVVISYHFFHHTGCFAPCWLHLCLPEPGVGCLSWAQHRAQLGSSVMQHRNSSTQASIGLLIYRNTPTQASIGLLIYTNTPTQASIGLLIYRNTSTQSSIGLLIYRNTPTQASIGVSIGLIIYRNILALDHWYTGKGICKGTFTTSAVFFMHSQRSTDKTCASTG